MLSPRSGPGMRMGPTATFTTLRHCYWHADLCSNAGTHALTHQAHILATEEAVMPPPQPLPLEPAWVSGPLQGLHRSP